MAKPGEKDTVVLTGTVGSHSYYTHKRLRLSVVVASPEVYFGLANWGSAGTKEDVFDDPIKGLVEHKYFNVVPLLWLDDQHYEVVTPAGQLLVRNRTLFNSKKSVLHVQWLRSRPVAENGRRL
jgi:hypothetical protein